VGEQMKKPRILGWRFKTSSWRWHCSLCEEDGEGDRIELYVLYTLLKHLKDNHNLGPRFIVDTDKANVYQANV